MPFYPSVQRDDGYDITDFYGIDERLGTAGDFAELIRTAADRGIRVIADLVVNHTSDQHPWFQAGRDPDSPFHDFYVWAEEKPEEKPGDVVFPDRRRRTGSTTARRSSGTCTASTRTSPTSTSPTRPCATRSRRSSATGSSRGWPASASTPCRS